MIEKIGQKLGINLNYFIPRGLWVSLRFFTITITALIISVAFARLTSKEIYGQYQYVISLASLLSVFSLPGLNTAALRAYVEGDEHAVTRSVHYSFIFSLLASVILGGVGLYKYLHAEQLIGLSLALAGILLPFFYAPNHWYIYYEGKLDFRASTIRLILLNIILLIGMILGLKTNLSLFWLVFLYFGINALLTLIFYFEARRKIQIQQRESKLSLPYALKCTVQKFTSTLGENVQTIAVSILFGFADLAIYQVAQSFVNAFTGLMAALSSTYFPLLLKYKHLNHNRIILQHIALGILFWSIYLIALRVLFTPLYGVTYSKAITLGYSVSFIVIFLPLRIYLINFFTAHDKNKIVIVTNIAASIVALVVFYLFRDQGFHYAAVFYLYTINIIMVTLLFMAYLTMKNEQPSAQTTRD